MARAVSVSVTGFFRDPEVFAALERVVVPALFAASRGGRPLRAWSAGTATGEEAWSLAMVLAAASARPDGFEVIATDIDDAALAVAREGLYSRAAAVAIPAGYRARFVDDDGPDVRVAARLRDRVAFVRHDLVGHRLAPPEAIVASFDLVLCRNVLIYFDDRMRSKALDRLAAVIEPGGVLVLGLAEWLPAAHGRRFEAHPDLPPGLCIDRARPRA